MGGKDAPETSRTGFCYEDWEEQDKWQVRATGHDWPYLICVYVGEPEEESASRLWNKSGSGSETID
jgi:hypothetical protein